MAQPGKSVGQECRSGQKGEIMDVGTMLADLRAQALKDPEVYQKLMESRKDKEPLSAFCAYARSLGYELYEMDVLTAGEAMYAQMKRSVNGGGENSPMLDGEDDYYEQFFADLEREHKR